VIPNIYRMRHESYHVALDLEDTAEQTYSKLFPATRSLHGSLCRRSLHYVLAYDIGETAAADYECPRHLTSSALSRSARVKRCMHTIGVTI
jgi:hypothetical protein